MHSSHKDLGVVFECPQITKEKCHSHSKGHQRRVVSPCQLKHILTQNISAASVLPSPMSLGWAEDEEDC